MSPPCWTTGLWPAVYESNYTLLAPHLLAKLTVLVCLAPGNSFHLYEMNVVEDGAPLDTSVTTIPILYKHVYFMCVFHNMAGFPIKDHSASRKTQSPAGEMWGPSSTNICFQRVKEQCKGYKIFPQKQL